jgi:DNA-binding MarR family transcriptional regulator
MADIIITPRIQRVVSRSKDGAGPAGDATQLNNASALGDASLLPLVEMLFFAYRDFTGEADAVLDIYGLGRAHHRVLHFVHRRPGIRVADLLELLKITKQSLGRVLRKLVADGWIEQSTGADDRRERHLKLTERGQTLTSELIGLQTRRIGSALKELDAGDFVGAAAQDHVRGFLLALIASGERASVAGIVAEQPTAKVTGIKQEARE